MKSTIIPTMRYQNAVQMIAWLTENCGFARHLVIEDSEGGIAHAQLTLGNRMIMLGSAREDEFGALMKTPTQSGAVTQSPYIVVEEVDALCEKVRAAGAEIIIEPKDEDYGGRVFTCRDPEGHVWNFGSYDPWTAKTWFS